MKRKILSVLLILTLIVSAMPMTISFKANAAENTGIYTWDDYEYRVININEIEIVSYNGSDSKVTIPSVISGMPVTSIGQYSFNGNETRNPKPVTHPNALSNKKIQQVVIPSSVKTICAKAFAFMDALTDVVFSEGLEVINEFALQIVRYLPSLNYLTALLHLNSPL